MIEIPVELGDRRYPIVIGHGLARLLGDVLEEQKGRRVLIVSSPKVWKLHGPTVARGLRGLAPRGPVLFPDGERYKTRETLARLHDAFLSSGLGRDGLVVAVGGGVVGDLAGFAAATYMRGIPWVGVPTTLLSMVDSSIGGKVGVNHPKAKNLLGAFHQPRAVVVDPAFLSTLSAREVRSGAYEVLKYGVIGDRALFGAFAKSPSDLREWSRKELENAIATSCRIKAYVVEKDEREKGLRKVLNLGHTLGHALETVTRYRRFTHGEAVGWGLLGAATIAWRKGLLKEAARKAIAEALDRLGPRPPVSDLAEAALLSAVSRDKKAEAGRVPFILPTAIGRVVIRPDVTVADIRHALKAMRASEGALL
ncbi:MAG TPA: 3-dehydroquinate synthase [Vicinamibacteria bacterium]|nr:3-dehydroquinate synthase [Vicinamibacteria bacterium]